jgi:hypothetical protein
LGFIFIGQNGVSWGLMQERLYAGDFIVTHLHNREVLLIMKEK